MWHYVVAQILRTKTHTRSFGSIVQLWNLRWNLVRPAANAGKVWFVLALLQFVDAGLYTAYINIEGDFKLPWLALVSWVTDTAVLAPLGFQRGFYATEFHPDTGQVMEVGNSAFELSSHQQKLNVTAVKQGAGLHISELCWDNTFLAQQLTHQSFSSSERQQVQCPHQCYVQLPNPYTGFWVATHTQMEQWVASNLWKKAEALSNRPLDWGYAETAAGSGQFVHVPHGFQSASVVPYNCHSCTLENVAGVPHLPNKYAALKQPQFSSSEASALLQ